MEKFVGYLACISITIAAFAAALSGPAKSAPEAEPLYSLMYVAPDGNAYAIDHALTADDCGARLAMSPGFSCEVEG